MRIDPFGVEQWMNAWETRCRFNLAETCVASLSVAELLDLAEARDRFATEVPALRLTYGAIPGSEALRSGIAGLYCGRDPADILVTHGTIGANHMVCQALIEPGDRVVSVVPTYQQHTSIPRSLGAEVVEVPLDGAAGWRLDLDRLAEAAAPGTKLVTLTNPNNPTGATLGLADLLRLAEIAESAGAYILCDEVYRGTEREGGPIPSIAELTPRGISTAGMSKTYALAGLRLGWIVAGREVLDACERHRDYTTISVGVIDDWLATLALGIGDRIRAHGRAITSANLAALEDWMDRQPLRWTRPRAGTVTLLTLPDGAGPSRALCERLLAETGVLLTPGSAMGMEGHLRIGFGNPVAEFAAGLDAMDGWFGRP